MGIKVKGKRYIPAVKDLNSGVVYPRQFGEEIHRCIYQRVEKELGLGYTEKEYLYDFMNEHGFVEGYVEVKSMEFLTRLEMEKLYNEEESTRLTRMGIVISADEKVFA
jgi:hypothetical protein